MTDKSRKIRLNQARMQELLDSFVILTDIRAAFFCENHELVNGWHKPICHFCSQIKAFPALASHCVQSDFSAFYQARATRALVLYRCPMGLWEAVTPTYTKGLLTGYLMFGQVRKAEDAESPEKSWARIHALLASQSLDLEQIESIRQAFFGLPAVSEEKLKAAANMLQLMTQAIMGSEVILICETDVITKTRQFLQSHYHRQITLRDIADASGLNPTYLSHLFHRQTGMTISDELNRLRISQAIQLLDAGNLPIKQIALQCGFRDQNYFSRFFRKHCGTSPQNFRRHAGHA